MTGGVLDAFLVFISILSLMAGIVLLLMSYWIASIYYLSIAALGGFLLWKDR